MPQFMVLNMDFILWFPASMICREEVKQSIVGGTRKRYWRKLFNAWKMRSREGERIHESDETLKACPD